MYLYKVKIFYASIKDYNLAALYFELNEFGHALPLVQHPQ